MSHAARPSRILVVDDDEGTARLLAANLRDVGHDTQCVFSGAEAVNRLQDFHPDLMLLDLQLCDVSGQELLQRLAREGLACPFVVITGQGDERVAVELMKQGALDYVVKDALLEDVLPTLVQRALDQVSRDHALALAQAALHKSQQEILSIVDDEQRRIGHDLHDSLGQQLTAIEFRLHSHLEDLDAPDLASQREELKKEAAALGQMIRDAIGLTRSLARGLTPVRPGEMGLMEALDDLAQRTNSLGGPRCQFDCPAPVALAQSQKAGHLFRIAQEAVNNALKHAQASRIVIRLLRGDGKLRLCIQDNGQGFSVSRSDGLGLSVMHHRANVLGGALTVESPPKRGVTVTCEVPIETP